MTLAPTERRIERLKKVVLEDRNLVARLLAVTEPTEFRGVVVEAARSHGIDLTPEEVDEEMMAARRKWLERRL